MGVHGSVKGINTETLVSDEKSKKSIKGNYTVP